MRSVTNRGVTIHKFIYGSGKLGLWRLGMHFPSVASGVSHKGDRRSYWATSSRTEGWLRRELRI